MRRNGGRRGFFSTFRDGGLFLATVFLGILIAAKLDQINSETHTGRFFVIDGDTLSKGEDRFQCIGIDLHGLKSSRRPLCRSCLDWSERRAHLAGSLGKALLSNFFDKGWARRTAESRSVIFSPEGERQFLQLFPVEA